MEKANAEPVVREKIIASEGGAILDAAREEAKREVTYNAKKDMLNFVSEEVDLLMHVASYGFDITSRLQNLDRNALVAAHVEDQVEARTTQIAEERIAAKVDAVRVVNAEEIERDKIWRSMRPYYKKEDIRMRVHDRQSAPDAQAVVFILWDGTSASVAKRTASLFSRLVQREHPDVDVVFIHAGKPQFNIANAEEAFTGSRSSETRISNDYRAMFHVLEERYPRQNLHRYLLQLGNGNTQKDDSALVQQMMSGRIIPEFQQVFSATVGIAYQNDNWQAFDWTYANAAKPANLRHSDILEVETVIPRLRQQYPMPRSLMPDPRITLEEAERRNAEEAKAKTKTSAPTP